MINHVDPGVRVRVGHMESNLTYKSTPTSFLTVWKTGTVTLRIMKDFLRNSLNLFIYLFHLCLFSGLITCV